jgi:DNA polymerase-4
VLAQQLQRVIREELALPCSLGVASNKLVAKIATDVGKAAAKTGTAPYALCVVPPGTEAAFLAPLPTRALWGIGPRTAERLAAQGIHTIGDLARIPVLDLIRRFGKYGADLAKHARGEDERPIQVSHIAKSLSKEHTFAQDVQEEPLLRQTLQEQAGEVARALQRKGFRGATITLKLRWSDFTTLTRQMSLPTPTDQEASITSAALCLFEQTWQAGRPVRLIGVGVSGFKAESAQMSLWETLTPLEEKRQQVEAALAQVRARFGEEVVHWGQK